MATEDRDYLEMAFRSIQCFTNDGKLMANELDEIIKIALQDGSIDANEQRVLRNIIGRLTPSELSRDMLQKIEIIEGVQNSVSLSKKR